MGAHTAPDGYPTTDHRPRNLHVAVTTHGSVIEVAGLSRHTTVLRHLPLAEFGATEGAPNPSWDEALVQLGYPRLGQWLHHAPEQLWLAEVTDPHTCHEGEHPLTTWPRRLYIVMTTQLPDSGLVIGPITAVTAAARTRLEQGHDAHGALINAYIRVGDHLVLVDVQTLQVTTATRATWYLVRTWLEQHLLDQHEQQA